MYTPYYPPQYDCSETEFRRQYEQRELKHRAVGIGFSLVGMSLLPILLSGFAYPLMMLLGFVNQQQFREEFMFMQPEVYYVFYMFLYLCMVVLPFLPLIFIFHLRGKSVFPTKRAEKTGTVLLACGAGLAVCMLANYMTTQWCATIEAVFGIADATPDMPMGDSVLSKILYACIFAVLPPLAEEFVFRGIVFGLLRPFGKTIAVFGSAFVFGLMHGNLVQIPFAFIGGLFFGYLVAETESIWPAIFLHFLNNGISVAQQLIMESVSDEAGMHVLYASFILVSLVGVLCLWMLMRRKNQLFRMQEDMDTSLANRKKFRLVTWNVGMIFAYVTIALQMFSAIRFV